MSDTASNVVVYTPRESGNEESRWIRLEQVLATLSGPTVADVAGMLDALFNLEPCDDGMGGGGEEAKEGPDDAAVKDELSILLERRGQCRPGYWLAAVNVYRTHEQPGYELRSETATVETVERVEESYRQVVDVNGTRIALERPYAGSLTGIPAGVNWEVRGGTVNLDRPVRDRLTLRYQTWHEYVTLRVPTKKTEDGEEYEPAAVVAFWGDMAAECELEPPEPENDENEAAKRALCERLKPSPPEPNDCWKVVRHYSLCECSRKRAQEWEEEVAAPCGGLPSGSMVGVEEAFFGYVGGTADCGEDEYDRELQDPSFYKKRCCKPLAFSPSRLPACRAYYAVYRGGHEIENGPEHWRNLYGDDVRMVAVMPEGGVCGEVITRWSIPGKNCCAEAKPPKPDPDNPDEIEPGNTYWIGVLDGATADQSSEWVWEASGGLVFEPDGETRIKTPPGAGKVLVRARNDICPNPSIRVDDGCSRLEMRFSGAESAPPSLSSSDLAVGGEQDFMLSASGGVPPYMWQASGGIRVLGWSADGGTGYFRTGPVDEWCVEEVKVVDQCGREATCAIRNALAGRWVSVRLADIDRCDPPGMPYDNPQNPDDPCGMNHWIYGRGYRAMFRMEQDSTTNCAGFPDWPCPAGHYITDGCRALRQRQCASWGYRWTGSCCRTPDGSRGIVLYQAVSRIDKWVCGDA